MEMKKQVIHAANISVVITVKHPQAILTKDRSLAEILSVLLTFYSSMF